MNEMYQTMLSAFDLSTDVGRRNAIFEVNQQVILSGLYQGRFLDTAAFYGGTCLRIFHGLQRFCEDMEMFKALLQERLKSTDMNQVKDDVLPFVKNPKELDIARCRNLRLPCRRFSCQRVGKISRRHLLRDKRLKATLMRKPLF